MSKQTVSHINENLTYELSKGRTIRMTLDGAEWLLTSTNFFPAQDFWVGDQETRHPKYMKRPISESLLQWVDRVMSTGAVYQY